MSDYWLQGIFIGLVLNAIATFVGLMVVATTIRDKK